jgi:hypothetical protein
MSETSIVDRQAGRQTEEETQIAKGTRKKFHIEVAAVTGPRTMLYLKPAKILRKFHSF